MFGFKKASRKINFLCLVYYEKYERKLIKINFVRNLCIFKVFKFYIEGKKLSETSLNIKIIY